MELHWPKYPTEIRLNCGVGSYPKHKANERQRNESCGNEMNRHAGQNDWLRNEWNRRAGKHTEWQWNER